MSSSFGSADSSPWWVALHRPPALSRAPVAAPAFRTRGGLAADLLGGAAAAAAAALAWTLLLAAVAAPAARLVP